MDDKVALHKQRAFDAATDAFTAQLRVGANWKHHYFGEAYSTRIEQAIRDVREACTLMEEAIRFDREALTDTNPAS